LTKIEMITTTFTTGERRSSDHKGFDNRLSFNQILLFLWRFSYF
jgi:hypothetical protein